METEAEVEAEAAAGDLAAAEAAVEESSDGGKYVDQKGKFRHPERKRVVVYPRSTKTGCNRLRQKE
eukprot:scaffold117199_cov63-Phaeocystis_antarctica.AAC.1